MARPPLIAHVIHHLAMGGLENVLVNLINRIPPHRYRHCVICAEDFSDFRDRLERPDVEVIALHKSTLSAMAVYQRMYSLFKTLRPKIVHSRNLSGLDALLPAWIARVPIRVHGEHGWDVADLDGTRLTPRLLRRAHAPLVHRYVAVSKDLERYLAGQIGIAPSRITQIYNGADTQRFMPTEVKPNGILPPEFYGPNIVVIGSVGRLQAVKDHATLIAGFAQLLRTHPSLRKIVRLAIVGDGPLRSALAECVQQQALTDIVWMPGARNDVARLYECFDVFVLPSLGEGISNTALEAMAAGLPIIATAVGGNAELVVNDVNGRLIPPSDPAALASELLSYVTDAELRSRHGHASRQRALSTFTIESMVDSYVGLYDSLCSLRS